jgi:hypothetical protein
VWLGSGQACKSFSQRFPLLALDIPNQLRIGTTLTGRGSFLPARAKSADTPPRVSPGLSLTLLALASHLSVVAPECRLRTHLLALTVNPTRARRTRLETLRALWRGSA